MTDLNHGTYGGYQAHRKAGQDACDDCKAAARDYVRHYRRTNPEQRDAQRRRSQARGRALERLGRQHPADFRALYDEELAGGTS